MNKLTDKCSVCGSDFGFHSSIRLNCPKGLDVEGFQETVFSPIEVDIEILQTQLTAKDNLIKELVIALKDVRKGLMTEDGIDFMMTAKSVRELDLAIAKATKQP